MKKYILKLSMILLISLNICAIENNIVKVEVLAKTNSSWDNNKLPKYQSGQPEITIKKITIPPKVKLSLHNHPVINAGVMLKGELTVTTEENEILNLKAGDAIVEVVNKWHFGKNAGNIPAEIIVFYAGIEDQAITIKKEIKN